MMDLLATYYAIQTREKRIIDDMVGFKNNECTYFTILATNKKAIHMEQAALAYYLIENSYHQTAFPVPNINGEWITTYQGNEYLVVKVTEIQKIPLHSHGKVLASYHQTNTAYNFEPQTISSYGQWKQLWIDKLTVFENKVYEEAKTHTNNYYRLLMDVLPYLIGISENAIQYMQESEHEKRYDESDQGTITFQRYQDNILAPIIWTNELVYDHPTRDIAEFIRVRLLQDNKKALEDIRLFMNDYQSIQTLSVFSWRLLYARLIFPIQLFDLIESGFLIQDFELQYEEMAIALENQSIYEQNLSDLFQVVELNRTGTQIPLLQWL